MRRSPPFNRLLAKIASTVRALAPERESSDLAHHHPIQLVDEPRPRLPRGAFLKASTRTRYALALLRAV